MTNDSKKKKEITIPGFLLLDFESQIRKEEKLGSGGAGSVFAGALLDKELISQHETDKIALKLVPKSSVLSEEESKEVFLQEVSLMWYDFFFSFLFFSFFFFLFFFFSFLSIRNLKTKNDINRSCSFHQNVVKLIGYTLEPEYYIITKKYELDLFTFIHHPKEDLSSLLVLTLTK